MKREVYNDIRKKPIDKVKYVTDKLRTGSKTKAVQKQKPNLAKSNATNLATRLEQDPVVQRLTAGIEEKIIELNAKRLLKVADLMESEDEKIQLGAAKEAGNVVERYTDRIKGKARQEVEVRSTKVNITLDLSGGAMAPARDFIDVGDDDGDDS